MKSKTPRRKTRRKTSAPKCVNHPRRKVFMKSRGIDVCEECWNKRHTEGLRTATFADSFMGRLKAKGFKYRSHKLRAFEKSIGLE